MTDSCHQQAVTSNDRIATSDRQQAGRRIRGNFSLAGLLGRGRVQLGGCARGWTKDWPGICACLVSECNRWALRLWLSVSLPFVSTLVWCRLPSPCLVSFLVRDSLYVYSCLAADRYRSTRVQGRGMRRRRGGGSWSYTCARSDRPDRPDRPRSLEPESVIRAMSCGSRIAACACARVLVLVFVFLQKRESSWLIVGVGRVRACNGAWRGKSKTRGSARSQKRPRWRKQQHKEKSKLNLGFPAVWIAPAVSLCSEPCQAACRVSDPRCRWRYHYVGQKKSRSD